METAAREATRAAVPAPKHVGEPRWLPLVGPALIVASVLVALRGFAFSGSLSSQHPDLLTFWLPRSCFLGRSLAAGHLPLWNPHELVGTPYLADPQSGWLSVLWMVLPTVLGCGAGLAAMVVVQPMIAGLGLHWFLRKEGLGRPAATAGGLAMAMLIAASKIAISMPFAGSLAWTPLLLVGASGYIGSRGARRLPWLALAAFAWGQVATAHLSHGLVIATALVVTFLVSRAVSRRDTDGAARHALLVVAFLAFLPLANLAILLPHFALIARSSLAAGYGALGEDLARAAGIGSRPLPTDGVWAGWPLALASTPGGYAGAVILIAAASAFRDRRSRALALPFVIAMAVAYLLTLDLLVGASWFRRIVLTVPYGDVYLHNPGRLRHLAILVAPILGAIGLQSLLDRPPDRREAYAWIGGPIALFLGWPLVAGANPGRLVIFAAGAGIATAVALRTIRGGRPSFTGPALVAVLAAELLAGALWSSAYRGGTVYLGLEGDRPVLLPAPLRWPEVPISSLTDPGRLGRTLQERAGWDRYLAWVPPDAYFTKGYLFSQGPEDRPALLLGRALILGLHDALGYSPVQLPRYWSYVRATNDLPVFYNASALQVPTLEDARLLGIGWLIHPDGVNVPGGLRGTVVAREGGFVLTRLTDAEPRVSVVSAWRPVPDGAASLAAVLAPGFDPAENAVIEDPSLGSGAGGANGTATYEETVPERVTVRVSASAPSLAVIRTAIDEGWTATVDGEPVPVVRADHLLQGVPVAGGDHVIELVYRDAWIGRGLLGSLVAWLGLVAAGGLARLRTTRRRARPPAAAAPRL